MAETSKTTLDWFGCRVQAEPRDLLEALRPMFGTLGPDLALTPLGKGRDGWQQASAVTVEDLTLARLDFGGESQRGWVRLNMPGKGCEWVQDWREAEAVRQLPRAQLRRVDVALTTHRGEITHERVLAAYAAGRFAPPGAGRAPHHREIRGSDPSAGRTVEIGSRKAAPKFMRCYEKGWQLLVQAGLSSQARASVTSVDGFNPADIYRCEVEFKTTDTHEVPWDVLDRPDEFFAGAYPFCQDVLPGVEVDLLSRRPERSAQRSLEIVLQQIHTQYGPALFTALTAYGGDMGAVFERICGRTHHKGLLEAGVLLVDHDAGAPGAAPGAAAPTGATVIH